MKKKYFAPVFYILILFSASVAQAQSEDSPKAKKTVGINAELAGGHENNIFKSTTRYFDRTLAEYLPKDSLITSDQFYDVNLDVDYSMKLKKSTIDVSLDNWYRGYFNYNNLNQLKSRFKALYGYNFTEKIFAGIQYQGTYSDKIAISTSGEELTRSFKYFENSGIAIIEYHFNKKNQITLEYAITHKKYLKEQLSYSLTNTENEISLFYKRRLENKHVFYMHLSHANRKYSEYQAFDQNGKLLDQNPMRNFNYTDIGFKFRYYLTKSFTVLPAIDYSIRNDMFEDYYSYKKIAAGSSIKYTYKKLKATAGIDYKQTVYDIKQAPSLSNSNRLKYKYIYTSLNVSYILNKKINAFISFESTSRDTNTELEYYRTLRPYNRYEILLGINYVFNNKL